MSLLPDSPVEIMVLSKISLSAHSLGIWQLSCICFTHQRSTSSDGTLVLSRCVSQVEVHRGLWLDYLWLEICCLDDFNRVMISESFDHHPSPQVLCDLFLFLSI